MSETPEVRKLRDAVEEYACLLEENVRTHERVVHQLQFAEHEVRVARDKHRQAVRALAEFVSPTPGGERE